MGEGSDRHELEERRAALRQLMPVVERLRGLDGVTWAGGQRHRNGAYLVRYPTYDEDTLAVICLLYTSPSPRDKRQSRMPSSA